jgi:hypothetical protein
LEDYFGMGEVVKAECNLSKGYLLPNENVIYAFETEKGFLVATDRRLTHLERQTTKGVTTYWMNNEPIPYDRLQSVSLNKEKARIEYPRATDEGNLGSMKNGQFVYNRAENKEYKMPKTDKSEKDNALREFEEHIRNMSEKIEEIKSSEEFSQPKPPSRDFSYLERFPITITEDGIYELNAFIAKQLDSVSVHSSIAAFIGDDVVVLKDCYKTKDEFDTMLAIGNKGMVLISGVRHNYHITSSSVHLIPYESMLALHTRLWGQSIWIYWTRKNKRWWLAGKWEPKLESDDERMKHPWFMLPQNGLWILSDLIYWKSGKPPSIDFAKDEKERADHRSRYLF